MNIQNTLLTIVFIVAIFTASAQNFVLHSPDNKIAVEVILKEKIYYTVSYYGERVMEASPLTLTLLNEVLGANPKILDTKLIAVNEKITTVWGSRKEIMDQYNQLRLDCEGDFSVEFRAYNNGTAYRFLTQKKDKQIIITNVSHLI